MGAPKGVKRPQLWKYPDPMEHAKHIPFLRQKAQALFRHEGWEVTFEYFSRVLWPDHLWMRRGKASDALCSVRIDPEKPWSDTNIQVWTRRGQLVRQQHPNIECFEVEPGVWDVPPKELTNLQYRKRMRERARANRTPRILKSGLSTYAPRKK